jgi:hypothetical protein
MSRVHNNLRFLKLATISLFTVILIVGCASQAYSVNNPDSRDATGEQLNEILLDNINEPLAEAPHEEEYQYDKHDDPNQQKEPGDIHDLDFDAEGQEVREFDNNFDGIPLQGSPVPSIISLPELCIYTSLRNVNCRASDYVETFTHGKFEPETGPQCWIALWLMDGPEEPYKNCQISVVDAPPPLESSDPDESDSPVCSSGLGENDCLAAGGTWGATSASCNCP